MKKLQCTVTGTLRGYSVNPGDSVTAGQEVAIVESMKMLIPVLAEIDGRVVSLSCKVDELVHEGDTLVELE
jgi:acetyl-CoA carboxylase biotin carboxyl carrier protein